MTDLTRDTLAEALQAVRDDATATGDVRVELTKLNGNIETLTTEVRLQIVRLDDDQRGQSVAIAEVKGRLAAVEQKIWKAAGAVGVLGIFAGGAGAHLLG